MGGEVGIGEDLNYIVSLRIVCIILDFVLKLKKKKGLWEFDYYEKMMYYIYFRII